VYSQVGTSITIGRERGIEATAADQLLNRAGNLWVGATQVKGSVITTTAGRRDCKW
jgi:hypothetical protein